MLRCGHRVNKCCVRPWRGVWVPRMFSSVCPVSYWDTTMLNNLRVTPTVSSEMSSRPLLQYPGRLFSSKPASVMGIGARGSTGAGTVQALVSSEQCCILPVKDRGQGHFITAACCKLAALFCFSKIPLHLKQWLFINVPATLKSQTCLNTDLPVKLETLLICLMAVLLSDPRS